METYAQALNIAIPFFLVLIAIEHVAAKKMGLVVNRGADMIASLSSGVTNTVKDVLGLSIAIIGYGALVDWLKSHNLVLYQLEATWLLFLVAFVAKDFAGYWIHRFEHEINVLWNRHVVHHSSEEFNLACALRQSISEILSFTAIFMLPAALLGVPAKVLAIVLPVQLFAQFWYHTRTIDRMGWLETVLVTPSHHRVHHAINPIYIDKNYSQIFIIWDKLFGTFQPELPDEPPVYGTKKPAQTWNPIVINFQHIGLLIRDAWLARNWVDKLKIWFMPTGWRPADVQQSHPMKIINDPSEQQKYDTHLSRGLLGWSWFQMAATMTMTIYMFNRIAGIGAPGIYLYGLFVFISVYSFTSLMDRNPRAVWFEAARLGLGIALIAWQGDWFGLDDWVTRGTWLVVAYLVASFAGALWFSLTESSREGVAEQRAGSFA